MGIQRAPVPTPRRVGGHRLAEPPRSLQMRVSIEGGIGCGKSSLLERLAQDGFDVRPEAAEACFDTLDLYYRDKARYGFLLQARIMSRYASQPPPSNLTIVERSPFSSLHVFAANQRKQGYLLDTEWSALEELYDTLGWAPQAMIFIDVPTEVSYQRMRERGRSCEQAVDLDYLHEIDRCTTEMLDRYRQLRRSVCVLDGTKSQDEVYGSAKWWLQHNFP